MSLGLGIGLGKNRFGAFGPQSPTNTVAPVISGTFEVGQTVNCTTGTWEGPTPITYAYQWQRNGVAISGATSSSYTIVAADDTNQLTCLVTATNEGVDSSAVSNIKVVGDNWILAAGVWDDTGVWDDNAVWID